MGARHFNVAILSGHFGALIFFLSLSQLNKTYEGGNRTGSILKAGLHLGPDCGL